MKVYIILVAGVLLVLLVMAVTPLLVGLTPVWLYMLYLNSRNETAKEPDKKDTEYWKGKIVDILKKNEKAKDINNSDNIDYNISSAEFKKNKSVAYG